jgi:hypothetical protein
MWLFIGVAIASFLVGGIATPIIGVYMFMHSPRLQMQMAQGMAKMMMGKGRE